MGLVIKAALIFALGAAPAAYRAQTVRPPDHVGFAVRYAPNVMERVAARRGIAPAPCMVAWTYATDRDIGRTWLHVAGPAGAQDCLAIDLPQDRDRAHLVRRRVLVELGYPSRWICGPGWTGRARDCPVRVWVVRE